MTIKEEVLKRLRETKPEVKKKYRVKEIALFGSFVRSEQKETSDIDILVEFEENADLFDLVGLALFLEEKLKRKVDVVPKAALRDELRGYILRDVIYA